MKGLKFWNKSVQQDGVEGTRIFPYIKLWMWLLWCAFSVWHLSSLHISFYFWVERAPSELLSNQICDAYFPLFFLHAEYEIPTRSEKHDQAIWRHLWTWILAQCHSCSKQVSRYQDISLSPLFFGIFTILFVFFPIFWKFKFHFLKKLHSPLPVSTGHTG